MPEGDTIFRTAVKLREWLEGREVTSAKAVTRKAPLTRVIGTTIDTVESQAKHLLIRFSNSLTLHTHMGMNGVWHTYTTEQRWRKPQWQMRVVVECGDHVAVCFNAPTVELISSRNETTHAQLQSLGPDILVDGFDQEQVETALAKSPRAIGELLLDQHIVSGIGNIFRCEALFATKLNPWTSANALQREELSDVISSARRLMLQSLHQSRRAPARVYGRAKRPCFVCGSAIEIGHLGNPTRRVFWCPKCQGKQPDANPPTGR